MKEYPTEKIRNVALAGHTSSGKTTLAEALLYHLKIADRLLRVDDGNSMSDYDPEEVRRKTSINTAVLPVEYAAHKMNILDLPGYRDFIGEIKNGIRVCDTVVIVVDGIAGGEMGTELAWEMADEYDLPRVAFINKLDKEHASFEKAVRSLKDTLGIPCVPVTLPVGAEASFSAVIDLLRMKVAQETPTQKPQYGDIPADMVETAQAARAALIEAAAEGDEALIEKFLEDKPLTEEEIVRGLKMAFMERRFLPVLCGAGLKQIGLAPLLDFIVSTVPAPGERKPIPARRADNQEPVERPISADAPFSAYVFKTVSDDYAGRLSFFKVYSGSITNDTTVSNPAHRRDERIGHLLIVRGKKQEEVHRLVAGDIGAVAKLAATATSDTLCTGDLPIAYDPTVLPSRTYSRAVVVRSKADEEKVSIA
ncbi:GTP-binding protein, partial [Candidatus Sumerlaeota bacterium]|nr:GTP-binding protein [Candidatus Sumerlaeota bacterium]